MNKDNNIIDKILELKENKKINAIFQYCERLNQARVHDENLPYEYILVYDNLDDFDEGVIENFSDYILVYKDEYIYKLILSNYIKLVFDIREDFDYDKEYEKNSLLKLIYDRDNHYKNMRVPTDISSRLIKPSEEEFYNLTIDFFSIIYDVGQSMVNDKLLSSQIIFEKARRKFIKMSEYYIGSEYDFMINLGENGANIIAYLDSDIYNKMIKLVSSDNYERMWTTIFETCSLFRKFGLNVGNKLEYTYPKKTDVEIMKFLRRAWNEKN